MSLDLLGIAAVTIMLVAYALEERSPFFVLAFAGASAAAAGYAVLIEAWPFAALEAIWSVVALARWARVSARRREPTDA